MAATLPLVHHFAVNEDWRIEITCLESGVAIDMRGRDYKIVFTDLATGAVVATCDTGAATMSIGGAGYNILGCTVPKATTSPLGAHKSFGADIIWYGGGRTSRLLPMIVNQGMDGSIGIKGYRGAVSVTVDSATLTAGNPLAIDFSGPPGPSPWKSPATWVTGTLYSNIAPADTVVVGGETYVCIVGHTASAAFATDTAKWQKVTQAGPANVLSVAATVTGAPGSSADVAISGVSPAQALTFTIPRGDTGATGGDAIGINARIKTRRELLRATSPDLPAVLDLDFAKQSLMLCSDDASAPQSGGIVYDRVEDFVAAIAGASFARSSSGRRWNHRGSYATQGSNSPRIGHAPATGSPQGLIIMPQQSLLLLRSEEFDNASWTKNALTPTANSAVAPDGNTTVDLLTEDATTAGRYVRQSFTGVASTAHTAFFIVSAAAGRSRCGIILRDTATSANQCRAGFNLATGAIDYAAGATGTYSAASAGIEALPGGYYLIWITGTISTDTAISSYLFMLDGSATIQSPTYLGNNTSGLLVWDGNSVSGTLLPLSLPTTTAQVTIQPDILRIPLGSWFNPSEGTFIVEATPFGINSTGNNQTLFAIDDGTTANNLRIRIDSGGAVRVTDGVAGVSNWNSASLGTAARGVREKLALTYRSGGPTFVSRLGAASVAGPSNYVMPTVTTLGCGNLASGFLLGGALGRTAYLPRAVTSAQVAALAA